MSQPNILMIVCDQLAQQAVSAYGCDWIDTPNIDRIINQGLRFNNAYCNSPLCGPSRASFWTGLYPHQTGVVSNGREFENATITEATPSMGSLFSAAGYRCVHFGKQHDSGALHGFDCTPEEPHEIEGPTWAAYNGDTYRDELTVERAIDWLRQQANAKPSPFFTVVDLQNPHNICGWVGAHASEAETQTPPPPEPWPDLPANFDVADFQSRPLPVQFLCCSHRRQRQAAHWPRETWQWYRAAYKHFTELVDAKIGEMIRALEATGQADQTLIVFMADHGDGMGCHKQATKHTSFYEETTRIPFALSGPPAAAVAGQSTDALFSLIDLLPTLAGACGIDLPSDYRATLPGIDHAPLLRGESLEQPHNYVVSQWHTEWGYTIEPGRMIRSRQYKYTRYLEDAGEELYDLEADPHEMKNLASDMNYAAELDAHRAMLLQHCRMTDDPFLTQSYFVDERWRKHRPGYQHHEGLSAAEPI